LVTVTEAVIFGCGEVNRLKRKKMSATAKPKKETKSAKGKSRVQFDLSKESLKKLDEIAEVVGASTRAEVIRRALFLYTEALEARSRGAEVFFHEADGTLIKVLF
jgi:hypothetical protein